MRILIANRGEIACRIARTAHRLGISTVGVYSEPDRTALHVDTVDLAVALGGESPAESYLRGDAIIRAALDTGADAVHPGYGFLAENAEFAQAVADAGLTWIGPTPDQIRLLGDKIAAKRAAAEAGVPTTQITEVTAGSVPDGLTLPVLVKAAAGGGGRGMRVVHEYGDLAEAIEAASREASSAFGDGTVFIEPFIERGRHVEVQILGDTHGNVVHLGDRECSIQRRNQKVIEEAPSPGISAAVRSSLHDGALALARHVGYVGVGTVEFMVGEPADGEPTITFLEVNTRLQVEHPVTEAITGIDLVEMQILVAAGEQLPFTQDDITFDGHAIEVRVVAEDPTAGWLPSTGTLDEFSIEGDVRVDTGFRAGAVVSSQYDSLLAKVIAHHADRDVAALQIARAMRTARIAGVRTNANMLAATMTEADFRAGATFTAYLAEHPEVTVDSGPTGDDRTALVIAATLFDEATNRAADQVTGFAPSGWRNLRTRGQRRSWIDDAVSDHASSDGSTVEQVEYQLAGDAATVRVGPWPEPGADGALSPDERRVVEVRILQRNGLRIAIEVDGRRQAVTLRSHADRVVASSAAGSITLTRPERWVDHDEVAIGGGPVCPLPGTVIAVHVETGQIVEAGHLLMVVEAMKMEHKIVAVAASEVADVRFAVGDRVDQGDLLVALTPTSPPIWVGFGPPERSRTRPERGGVVSEPVRIANCSGFFGDRLSGAREMVEGGPIDVLTGDWLAELTMLILSRIRAKKPGGGFASTFVTQMDHVMGTCLDRGIKVVSNAGGLDPAGCADAVHEVADRLGLSPTIAYVDGDDLLPRIDELAAVGALRPFHADGDLGDLSRYLTANAYLGCWGIVEALQRGADIVITGRVTDAAVTCGPAAWHHGWARDDWDQLAGAVVAGHVIECSAQATGGNYSFFTEVPGMERLGFPWADIAADGSSVIGKHDVTGGQVSIGTVTSQLLYEIGGTRYLGPDVTARFDTIRLDEIAPDRVEISGTVGEPPPSTLKVAMNELGGYRNTIAVALTGLDIDAKAAVAEAAFWRACPYGPDDFASVTSQVIHTEHLDPASNEAATAQWRLTVKDHDERKVGRAFSNAFIETALASVPGFYGLSGGPNAATPYGVYRPALVPADVVPQYVHIAGATAQVDSVAPQNGSASDQGESTVVATNADTVESERVPLGTLFGARSGDKGGNANVGVFARDDAAYEWLARFLTVERLQELLPETGRLRVDRHDLANLRSLNFVVYGLLDEGVAASTRIDAQAKSLGEWLRARHADIPTVLLHP